MHVRFPMQDVPTVREGHLRARLAAHAQHAPQGDSMQANPLGASMQPTPPEGSVQDTPLVDSMQAAVALEQATKPEAWGAPQGQLPSLQDAAAEAAQLTDEVNEWGDSRDGLMVEVSVL